MDISKELAYQMYQEYMEGQSIDKVLTKKYGISRHTIYKCFDMYGLKRKNDREKSLKFTLNQHYFDIIDTEDKAYWLGLMFADGYVTSDRKYFGICLTASDRYLLDEFREDLQATHPVHNYVTSHGYSNSSEYSKLLISNPYTVDVLIKHGVVPHKSNILKPPTDIPSNLIRHFIRGYFDGDGCITICNNGVASIEIISTPQFLDFITDELLSHGCIDRRYPYSKRKAHQIVERMRFAKTQSLINTFHYLYDNSNHKLQRKYDKFVTFFNSQNIEY